MADQGGATATQQQQAQLRSIKQVWGQYGKRFTVWWEKQSKERRLGFSLEWCPYMPLSRRKPYIIVDGKKEDMRGSMLITPEWNQEEVVEGNRLIDLITEVATVPDIGEPGAAPGYDAYTELCYRTLPTASNMVGNMKSQLPKDARNSGIVMLMPGNNFGQTFVVKQMVPQIKAWLDKGVAIPAVLFEAVQLRLGVVMGSVAMCLDHYRVEVLGREGYKAIGPQMGCAACGAVERKDTSAGRLMACSACGAVFYCGKECQVKHWKEHKPHCKPKELWSKKTKPKAAAAGASSAGDKEQSTTALPDNTTGSAAAVIGTVQAEGAGSSSRSEQDSSAAAAASEGNSLSPGSSAVETNTSTSSP